MRFAPTTESAWMLSKEEPAFQAKETVYKKRTGRPQIQVGFLQQASE